MRRLRRLASRIDGRQSQSADRNGAAIGAGESFDFSLYWSEWQDLNLRPPRPERGALSSAAAVGDDGSLRCRIDHMACIGPRTVFWRPPRSSQVHQKSRQVTRIEKRLLAEFHRMQFTSFHGCVKGRASDT
jgi:hypothetical protein